MSAIEGMPGQEFVGALIGDAARRSSWRDVVAALARESRTGGPLEGWLFHGTSGAEAESIAAEGLRTTDVLLRDEDGQYWTDGTHWATAWIAAFYAEDRIESTGDPDLPLALVAARLSDIGAEGVLAQDEQSLDAPIVSRLGETLEGVAATYERALADGQEPWRASLAATGSLVCLSPVGPERLAVIRGLSDVARLLESAAAPGAPAP
jgi:hypothetical protein